MIQWTTDEQAPDASAVRRLVLAGDGVVPREAGVRWAVATYPQWTVKSAWSFLEQVERADVGVAWTVDATGESASVVVPTLGHRLFQVRISADLLLSGGGASWIDRLRGIGFAGQVVITPPGDIEAALAVGTARGQTARKKAGGTKPVGGAPGR